MKETKPVYYINGDESLTAACAQCGREFDRSELAWSWGFEGSRQEGICRHCDDLPPILRAPTCELPRRQRHDWRYIIAYAGVVLAAAAGAVAVLAWVAWRMVAR